MKHHWPTAVPAISPAVQPGADVRSAPTDEAPPSTARVVRRGIRVRKPETLIPATVAHGEDGRLIIRMPVKLVSESNTREHWRRKAERVAKQRETVGLLYAVLAHNPFRALPHLVRITRIAPYPIDGDNCTGAAKHVRDEIAVCLGLASDRDPRVEWRVDQRREGVRTYGVEIAFAWKA